jgi:hypothetical protein
VQQWTWVAIGGIAVFVAAILWAVFRLRSLANEAETKMLNLQSEVSATLRQAQETLGRVEILVQRSDLLLRDKVSPSLDVAHSALEHVERSALRIAAGVERIQGPMKFLAAMGAPGAAAMLVRRIPGRGGRLGLLALAAGAVVRALFARQEDDGSNGEEYESLPYEENHVPPQWNRREGGESAPRPMGLEGGPLAAARMEP